MSAVAPGCDSHSRGHQRNNRDNLDGKRLCIQGHDRPNGRQPAASEEPRHPSSTPKATRFRRTAVAPTVTLGCAGGSGVAPRGAGRAEGGTEDLPPGFSAGACTAANRWQQPVRTGVPLGTQGHSAATGKHVPTLLQRGGPRGHRGREPHTGGQIRAIPLVAGGAGSRQAQRGDWGGRGLGTRDAGDSLGRWQSPGGDGGGGRTSG